MTATALDRANSKAQRLERELREARAEIIALRGELAAVKFDRKSWKITAEKLTDDLDLSEG